MNWFIQTFGFEEVSYEKTRAKFLEMFFRENCKKLNNINSNIYILLYNGKPTEN